ncbi:hypothetical protein P153DRAFT_383483 [Dothidotthia symphoricarpi CBS 119687]|uniref:Uncharacterized protein n=1 Tax=Dothidotthia symphoricarpi CBS 119687 TaxID=1392245 RepID=A0A6A6AHA6_9PLEO|nr:uncharacterized protein P153DRAFT_383483 [Dothidotthia symphoricarpi CBS 119687]KAF2131372.1 hypothetical protein P153DRAFT_383483 [Dothidotthia symphoricarpi CBS 119687]
MLRNSAEEHLDVDEGEICESSNPPKIGLPIPDPPKIWKEKKRRRGKQVNKGRGVRRAAQGLPQLPYKQTPAATAQEADEDEPPRKRQAVEEQTFFLQPQQEEEEEDEDEIRPRIESHYNEDKLPRTQQAARGRTLNPRREEEEEEEEEEFEILRSLRPVRKSRLVQAKSNRQLARERVSRLQQEEEQEEEEAEEEAEEEEREVSWSLSPVRVPRLAQDKEPEQGLLFGEHCYVLCRLSSAKAESSVQNPGLTHAQLTAMNVTRRINEGIELARRLVENCPERHTFTDVTAVRLVSRTVEGPSFLRASNKYTRAIRAYFEDPARRGKKVTLLIRGLDGLVTSMTSMESLLIFLKSVQVQAQFIFQFNKVTDMTRPNNIRNYRGLGGIIVFMDTDFQNYIDNIGKVNKQYSNPDLTRLEQIWKDVQGDKSGGQGIQDRNTLLSADATKPEGGKNASSVGRKKAR